MCNFSSLDFMKGDRHRKGRVRHRSRSATLWDVRAIATGKGGYAIRHRPVRFLYKDAEQ
ncbi:hypothetical protein [Nostoc sp. ChiQUE01b]|uniref:hypothetical protein n=1 Tax=Nostoc sp. ChiQUE01b TaxID=3075376 RepID=UPI002AD43775|nr:hypothetical protein [Nostoc sp. ChiQUE01b]